MKRRAAPRRAAEPTTTAAEIRSRLGISERSCSRLIADLRVVRRGPGGRNPVVKLWDLAQLLHARGTERGEQEDKSAAKMAELRDQHVRKVRRENDVAEGKLVARAQVEQELALLGTIMRREIEVIERTHGPAAGDLKAMLARFEDEFGRSWRNGGDHGDVAGAGVRTDGSRGGNSVAPPAAAV